MIDKFARHIRHEDIITPVLNSEVLDSINEIKTNFFQCDKLRQFGINPFSKILFSGQSGCGKNLVAGYLAKQMKLKFFQTKPEAFMGHPKDIFQNLRLILDAASKTNNYILYVEDYS
ncbi:MAG: AAA family ATPase, partial [Trichodesmium sp. St19_bin1]|nr:AAA family ATPase [Trichodesmium sp. St19_bin1]